MDLRDEGASGVHDGEASRQRLRANLGRDPVRGEYDDGALGNVFQVFDEDDAALLEGADDPLVVDDRVAHVERRAVRLQGEIDDLDRERDPGAEPSGGGQEDSIHWLSLLRGALSFGLSRSSASSRFGACYRTCSSTLLLDRYEHGRAFVRGLREAISLLLSS